MILFCLPLRIVNFQCVHGQFRLTFTKFFFFFFFSKSASGLMNQVFSYPPMLAVLLLLWQRVSVEISEEKSGPNTIKLDIVLLTIVKEVLI